MVKRKTGKKVLKVILYIIAVIIVIFLVHAIKNYIIITNLQNKISRYADSTNFYIKTVSTQNSNGAIVTMQSYKKDNKEVVFIQRNLNEKITKMSIYDNEKRIDMFFESADSKTAKLGVLSKVSTGNIYNSLETDNKWQTFLGAISSRIKSVKYNGKDCYKISEFMSSTLLSFDNQKNYIEKETGLLVKVEAEEMITEREQEFNNVDDSIFVKPDISEYTIQEE